MKKLLFVLFATALFACGERKIDPRQVVILEFLDKLKTEEVCVELLHSKYFKEGKFYNEVAVNSYLQILSYIKETMNESSEIKVMTYAEALSRSIEVPTITNQNTDNIFVIKMDYRYALCVMNGDKIESLIPLWRVTN